VAKYTHKGSLVGVEGRIQTRSYDDKDGKRVYVTEVVADNVRFLDSRNAGGTNSAYVPGQESMQSSTDTSNSYPSFSNEFTSIAALDISDDDLPF
ncbi:single-stranded DNA-binding protein, partial [[Clostridium] innocuum]